MVMAFQIGLVQQIGGRRLIRAVDTVLEAVGVGSNLEFNLKSIVFAVFYIGLGNCDLSVRLLRSA